MIRKRKLCMDIKWIKLTGKKIKNKPLSRQTNIYIHDCTQSTWEKKGGKQLCYNYVFNFNPDGKTTDEL